MRILAAFFLISCSISAHAGCTRPDRIDPEFPAGLTGVYELLGRDPISGAAYTGVLTLGEGTRAYSLKRKLGSRTVSGEAWIERCGADAIVSIYGRYKTTPKPLELQCALGGDGDNYYRLTCRTHYLNTPDDKIGLEAMFQRH